MTGKIVVLSSCGSAEEAERIGRELVEQKLAACVTVIPQARSFYRWDGKVADSGEYMLLIKSSRPLFDRLSRVLGSAHSYSVPEIIALPVVEGSANYLAWMDSELVAADVE